MKRFTKHSRVAGGALLVAGALVLLGGLMGSCGAVDDFNSRLACEDYCAKRFECLNQTPTGDETSTCVSACRNSIEDNCGNEHQAAANDKINECVDKGCVEFGACMVFGAAPECFGFVTG